MTVPKNLKRFARSALREVAAQHFRLGDTVACARPEKSSYQGKSAGVLPRVQSGCGIAEGRGG